MKHHQLAWRHLLNSIGSADAGRNWPSKGWPQVCVCSCWNAAITATCLIGSQQQRSCNAPSSSNQHSWWGPLAWWFPTTLVCPQRPTTSTWPSRPTGTRGSTRQLMQRQVHRHQPGDQNTRIKPTGKTCSMTLIKDATSPVSHHLKQPNAIDKTATVMMSSSGCARAPRTLQPAGIACLAGTVEPVCSITAGIVMSITKSAGAAGSGS